MGKRLREESRLIGEERFQRAMYLKTTARGEHHLTIYDGYPAVREVIRY